MLQLRTAGYKAIDNLRLNREFPLHWNNARELEQKTDTLLQRFLAERFAVSQELGPLFFLGELLDRTLRTDELEIMDSESVPETEKFELVKSLDRQNGFMGLYSRYVALLFPLIADIAERKNRRVKLLELASGSGGLALALASEAEKQGLPLSVTGSDIVPHSVAEANRLAGEKKLPVTFRLLDALRLEPDDEETFDMVLISQSMHHFTPGQLAVMIANAEKRDVAAFVGIDGFRDLLLGIGMPLAAALQANAAFTMDAMTSSRKFYSEPELDLIAEAVAGAGCYVTGCSWPMSVIAIRFDGGNPQLFSRQP